MFHSTMRSVSLASTALALVAGLLVLGHSRAGEDGEDDPDITVTLPTAVEVALLRAGLSPEALAAAGVSSDTLASQLASAADGLTPLPASLATADAAYGDARRNRDRLQRLVRSGLGTADDVQALADARTALAAAEAQRAAVLDAVFAAATADLSDAQAATLGQIRANARWKHPIQYRVAARSEADWFALSDALAHVRTHTDFGLDTDPAIEATLEAFDAEGAVSQATTNCSTHLSGCAAVWEATFVD